MRTWRNPGSQDEFLEIASGITEVLDDEGTAQSIDDTPDAFVEWLRSRVVLDVGEPINATVDGLPATQIDVVAQFSTQLYTYPDAPTTYGLAAGQRVRFITLMVGDTRVQIAAEAPDATLDPFWGRVEPIVESLTFPDDA